MSRYHARITGKRNWEAARHAAIERAGHRCQECGLARPLAVHHVRALHLGGAAYDPANLRALCKTCHYVAHGSIRPTRNARLEMAIDLRDSLRDIITEQTGVTCFAE